MRDGRTTLSGERNWWPGRAATGAPRSGREQNYCLPRASAHTLDTPGRTTFAAEYMAAFLFPSCGRTALGLLHVGNLLPPKERVFAGNRPRLERRRFRNFSLNARLLGGDLRGETTERRPRGAA
jgi:hypothetical protein